ncbi:MAG: hypothetical protein U0165_17965 [Polyangiaceae bacterium]
MNQEKSSAIRASMLTAALALIPIVLLRGFTVDDAWIPARYAANLAAGAGYKMNAGGPSTDGVTPLPFAPLLSLLSGLSPRIETCWVTARWTGAVAWLLAAGVLGRHVASLGTSRRRFVPLVLLSLSAPLGAWSVAGLETGLVMALTTLAAVSLLERDEETIGVGVAGLAAAFRPELLPFALALALSSFPLRSLIDGAHRFAALFRTLGYLTGPWLVIVVTRMIAFGSPVPLSAIAKPSDLAHGAIYVLPGALLIAAPIFVFARHGSTRERALVIACAAHFVAVLVAGGDWMPLWRLLTPVVPVLIAVGAHVAERSTSTATIVRATFAFGLLRSCLGIWWVVMHLVWCPHEMR